MTAIQDAPASVPDAVPSRGRRMTGPALTLGGLALATLALRLRDPHQQGSWGFCPLASVGIWCPGCGGLRATNDLTHGDLAAAASSNLLFVLSIPLVIVLLGRWTAHRWNGRSRPLPPALVQTGAALYAVLALVFMVLRNTPAGAWLAP